MNANLLKIRGVGYKFFEYRRNLVVDLGLTHYICIPKNKIGPDLVLRKTKLFVYGEKKSIIGNFITKVVKLKKIDSYKGKGVSQNDLVYKLKTGKVKN